MLKDTGTRKPNIAIASGKGGTGKTTVAVNLALTLAGKNNGASYIDCDVEAPNGHLFLSPQIEKTKRTTLLVPRVDIELCDKCGKCSEICHFGAIVAMRKKVLTYPELCHSCGGCQLVCPQKAITEVEREIGTIESGHARGLRVITGRLNVGEASAVPLIRAVKAEMSEESLSILDAPPGTSCPVIEAIRGTDYVVLVTEPTPFGMNDLMLAVETTRKMSLPFGVVINRSDLGDDQVERYCRDQNIPVLASIPFSREISETYAQGLPLIDHIPVQAKLFEKLSETVVAKALQHSRQASVHQPQSVLGGTVL